MYLLIHENVILFMLLVFSSVWFWLNDQMVLFLCTLLQSNKKEKEAAPPETKNVKELALDSSEKTKLSSLQPHLQPQPPSSPAPSESKRSGSRGERGVKRCLKNKTACDKAATDSVGGKGGAGDDSATTGKSATVSTAEQQPQEPSAKRTIVRPPKTTKEAVSPADRDAHSVKAPVANGKAPHAHTPAGRSPQTQRRDGDNRAERLSSDQEQNTAASHTNKTQVRTTVITSTGWFFI